MPRVRSLAVFTVLACLLGYFSYVWYPDACDFPVGMKAFYSLTRLATHVSNFVHFMGGSYVKCFRLLEFNFSPNIPEVEMTNVMLGGVPTTIFKPSGFAADRPGSAIVYYHGGGWAIGSVDLYAAFIKVLAKESGMIVVFPEYRLAPEYPYPIPLEDCVSATMDLFERLEEFKVDPEKIIFAGDSAGGNLAAAVSLRLGREKSATRPCLMNVMYPVLQMSNLMMPSYQQNPYPPLADPSMMAHFFLLYMGMQNETRLINSLINGLHMEGLQAKNFAGKIDQALIPERYKQRPSGMRKNKLTDEEHSLIERYKTILQRYASDPEFAPLSASDEELKLLPKSYILTCEYDILRDDGILLHERMKSLGMDSKLVNLEFGAHGIFNLYGAFTYDKLDRVVSKMISNMKSHC